MTLVVSNEIKVKVSEIALSFYSEQRIMPLFIVSLYTREISMSDLPDSQCYTSLAKNIFILELKHYKQNKKTTKQP